MLNIQLHDLLFEAFHGIHEEEKILGNKYVVNCSVEIHEPPEIIRHLSETVDYTLLYQIIRERMSVSTPLLETVAMEMGDLIHHHFSRLKSISVEIIKLHPPIQGFVGKSIVKWHKEY